MKIVIDITENMYQAVKDEMWCGSESWYNALKNGTPLPKGCGRLGDLDALEKRFLEMAEDPWNIGVGISSDIEDMADVISEAPTIIEANKGEE